MKCPLLTIGLSAVAAKEEVEMEDCIKSACEWWDEVETVCHFETLSRNIEYIGLKLCNIADALKTIADLMPRKF